MGSTGELEAAVRGVSRRQHGVVTRAQALACGFSDDRISTRVRSGVWGRPYPGVYGIAGVPETFESRAMAAVLACGDGALASHGTAAALYGLELPGDALEVTIPGTRRAAPAGIVVHRARVLGPLDRASTRQIPCTGPMRTLVDLAGVLDPDLLEELLDDALHKGLVEIVRFSAYLAEPSVVRRPGTGHLRGFLRDRAERGIPESRGETRLDRVLRRANLPLAPRQVPIRVGGSRFRLDFVYVEERVVLEFDGYLWHAGRRLSWQESKRRRNLLRGAGWDIVELTWYDVRDRPVSVCCTVGEALGLRPVRWVPARRRR